MKNLTAILFFLFMNLIYSQNESLEESLKYYPLEIGNFWQYESTFDDGWGNDSSWYAHREVVGDTTMPNGKKYFIIVEDGIQTLSSNLVRIDSTNGYVYSYINDEYENSEDSLVISDWDSSSCETVGDVYIEELFGHSFETRPYFGCVITVGCSKSRKMSKNLGLIELKNICANVVASSQNYTLNYAKINNVEYGTLVNVNNANNDLVPNLFSIKDYPNPFNGQTIISYSVPTESYLSLKIYDLFGREVITLFSGHKGGGTYTEIWEPKNISSGIYIAVLNTKTQILTTKLQYLK